MRDSLVLELEVVADAHMERTGVAAQELIVVAATATNTVALMIKGYAGHEDHINMPTIALGLGFGNAEVTMTHHVLAVVGAHLHIVAMGDRQQHDLLVVILLQERTQVHLVVHGIVEHNDLSGLEAGRSLNLAHDSSRTLADILLGHHATFLLHERTQGTLFPVLAIPGKPCKEIMYVAFE